MKHARFAAATLLALSSLSSAWAQAPSKTEPERLAAWFETRSEQELKDTYLRCAAVSTYERMLTPEESMLCVISADVLQKRSFNGDLNEQAKWWKEQPAPKDTNLEQDMKRAQEALSRSAAPTI